MANLKVWYIEEIRLESGEIGHRQTVMEFDEDTGDWIRPDNRLADAAARTRWNTIVNALSNMGAKNRDRSWIINPVALMDYCNNISRSCQRRKRGTNRRTQDNE